MGRVKEQLFQLDQGAGSDSGLDLIALALGGEVKGRAVLAPSPGCAADDRSMVVHVDPSRPYDFFIYGCEGPLRKARELVSEKLKLVAPDLSNSLAEERSAQALRLWDETIAAAGTLVESYLRSRAIDIPAPPVLRFHPALRHAPSGTTYPAMVALVTDVTDAPVAIHRTWLQRDGSGKALVEPSKMTLGPIRGNEIRLSRHTDQLLIGEGIETC
jgi:hypothetical protein